MTAKRTRETNLFDLIPEPKIRFEDLDDGTIILIKPKFKNKWLVRYILPRLSKPNFRIKLDRLGSFVWKQCDGRTTVGQIVNLFQTQFEGDIGSVQERVVRFVQMLRRHDFIAYKDQASSPYDSTRT